MHRAPANTMSESLTPSHAPVRLAIAGLGGHGWTIQNAAGYVEGIEVVGVYDPNDDEARRSGERFGITPAASYEAMLETPGLEAVALVTPNRLHRAQAEAALARGLHVFVEKPIAHTTGDGRAMIEAADRAGRVLMVGHNMRYGAPAQQARTLIREGAIGEVVGVEIHFSSDTGRRLDPDSWRLRPDEAPILPVTQLGIHALDLVHALMGPIEAVGAFARTVATPAPVVDSVVATFRLAGGPMGTMTSHYCTPVRFTWAITGMEGALLGTPHTLDLVRGMDEPERVVDVRGTPAESYEAQMDAFARAVRTGTPPESDGPAGLAALAVVEAMVASVAAGGAPVNVFARHGPD
jgi:UDP-N-acetylglucosamine 3-dehydrogenase